MKTPVSRVGNKSSVLHILSALFPLNYGRFIDVFGGSGSVLLGNPEVCSFEVYNDFDRNLARSYKDGKGEMQYSDTVFALTKEARTALNEAVVTAYEEELDLQADETEDESEDFVQSM